MRIIFFLLVLLFQPFVSAQKLMILGDSLSAAYGLQQHQGWVHLLQDKTQWQLINASISGETTAGGLARLPTLLSDHQPDAVLIELGGNDGLRGFAINIIETNLSNIIELVKQNGATPVLMQIRIPPNYGPRYGQQFSKIYPQLAEKHQIKLWPFFMDEIAVDRDLMMGDGIHPNANAQPKISEFVSELLEDFEPE